MAMSVLWTAMVVLAVFSAVLTGRGSQLTGALMDGAGAAVQLCISLAGTLCLWSALARLMEHAGLSRRVEQLLRPVLRKLYPDASQKPAAFTPLCANVCANLLGLGSAATPLGIAAVKQMQRGQEATDEMCRLIVMNTASIQLLPTTVAALRANAGSQSPFRILPAVWLTSILSVSAGLIMCRILKKWL